MDICSEIFKVTLPDVGENNRLTNKAILRMFQEIACIHSSYSGFGVNDAEKTGNAWILLNWKLMVFSRPVWNKELKINTWSSNQNHLSFYRDFEIYDENNTLVAVATSKWVLYDIKNCSLVKITEDIKSKYAHIDRHVFSEKMPEKLKEPENSILVSEYSICRHDIDTNHHVNNLNYLDYAMEALSEDEYLNSDFNNVEIMYKHQATLGDTLCLYYGKEENSSIITIKNKNDNKLHCIVKLY